MKVADVAPAGIVTVAGTVAAVLLETILTTEPPVGAAEEIDIVPVAELPAATTVGLIWKLLRIVGWIVSGVENVRPPEAAVIVEVILDATKTVEIVNVPVVAPAGIVTLDGHEAPYVEDNWTTTPPDPAGPLRVTVPVEETPPINSDGESTNPTRTSLTSIVSVAVAVPL